MKLYRASGKPVLPTHYDLYMKELNTEMDKLEVELGKCTSDTAGVYTAQLDEFEINLRKKYPNQINILYPKTQKQLSELCKKYGSVAFCLEEGKLVAYVLDA